MALDRLNHELITLIADYLPVRAVARLAMVCKLTYFSARHIAQYVHMCIYRHTIKEINNIKI